MGNRQHGASCWAWRQSSSPGCSPTAAPPAWLARDGNGAAVSIRHTATARKACIAVVHTICAALIVCLRSGTGLLCAAGCIAPDPWSLAAYLVALFIEASSLLGIRSAPLAQSVSAVWWVHPTADTRRASVS